MDQKPASNLNQSHKSTDGQKNCQRQSLEQVKKTSDVESLKMGIIKQTASLLENATDNDDSSDDDDSPTIKWVTTTSLTQWFLTIFLVM